MCYESYEGSRDRGMFCQHGHDRASSCPGIDWVNLGKGMGISSVKVTTAEELERAFGRALNEKGPTLIQMVI